MTLTIRSVLRVGSVLAGTVSVSWGAYIVQASAALWKSGPTPNPFTSSDFLTLSMYEAILVGLFALVLAILSR